MKKKEIYKEMGMLAEFMEDADSPYYEDWRKRYRELKMLLKNKK